MTERRAKGPRRLANFVRPAIEPVVAKRGLTQASLILDWRAIAGDRLAGLCQPAKLQWPPRGPKSLPDKAEPAVLWLRVLAGRGLEVQYQAQAIIARVNAHFGWRCVAKIAIRPELMQVAPREPAVVPPDAVAVADAAARAETIDDDALKAAMTRLGAAVIAKARRTSRG